MLTILTLGSCGSNDTSSVSSDLSMADDVSSYLEALDLDYAYDLAYTLAYDEEYWDNELGWRTSGSDAEHKTADFLVEEMESIGLTDVEKIATDVDKFQFNDSSLTIKGTDIDLTPAAYQCNGTDEDGITAEIVDVANGFESDYDGKDVEGKIVLAGVDQWNVAWIDSYIRQAYEKGAAAIVTYSVDGYGTLNDDTINVQDVCCDDLIPALAISANQAADIQAAIEEGNNEATLVLDAVLEEGEGTTYNVVGKIEGKSSDQQILIAGHYDKYWYGFQDDSAAIALDFTIAKAMIDSGYTPENDIYVIAHGAEEWGVSDSQYDWTTGAWGVINDAHPEWSGSTIALLNCELPAFSVENNELNIVSVPEFRTLVNKLVADSGLVVTSGDVTISETAVDATNMEDGVSYRWHGVPYMINGFEDETFITQRYHTTEDSSDTWDEDTMRTNLNWYGAFAIYIDKTPALELDITALCDDLENNLNEDLAAEAGVDTEEYQAALDSLREAAEANNDKIADINAQYEEYASSEENEDEIAALREEGREINKTTLEAFAAIQENYLKADDLNVYIGHPTVNDNAEYLQGIISALEDETLYADDEESGALDIAWQLNSMHDYGYYNFSEAVTTTINEMYDADKVSDNKAYWGLDKMVPVVYVGETTYDLVHSDESDVDYDAAIEVYQEALDETLANIKTYCQQEIEAAADIADILK